MSGNPVFFKRFLAQNVEKNRFKKEHLMSRAPSNENPEENLKRRSFEIFSLPVLRFVSNFAVRISSFPS